MLPIVSWVQSLRIYTRFENYYLIPYPRIMRTVVLPQVLLKIPRPTPRRDRHDHQDLLWLVTHQIDKCTVEAHSSALGRVHLQRVYSHHMTHEDVRFRLTRIIQLRHHPCHVDHTTSKHQSLLLHPKCLPWTMEAVLMQLQDTRSSSCKLQLKVDEWVLTTLITPQVALGKKREHWWVLRQPFNLLIRTASVHEMDMDMY